MRAYIVETGGDAEVLQLTDIPMPETKSGWVLSILIFLRGGV